MGVLDDLKQKAEAQKAQEQSAKQREAEQQQFYQQELRPRLEKVYTFLNELIQHLNYLKPDLRNTYELPGGVGQLASLRQERYQIEADSREHMTQVSVKFYCLEEGTVTCYVEGKENLDKLNEFFHQCRLRYKSNTNKDDKHNVTGGGFEVEKVVPIVFQFNADIENGNIILWIRNFEKLGLRKIILLPNQVNDKMLDDLARYITREIKQFMQLDISEDSRKQLQERLKQEQVRRELELKVAEQIRQEEEQKEKESKLMYRLKKQAQEALDKVKKKK